jgi:outer membrane protein OmpA-like peptidoglycan-associated protein
MKEKGVFAGGMAAFALLCAFAAWWIGPATASKDEPAAQTAARSNVVVPPDPAPSAPPPASSPLPLASASPAPSPTATAVAVAPTPTATPMASSKPAASPAPVAAAVSAQQVEADIAKKLASKTIEFESLKDQLTPNGKAVLDSLVPLLEQAPNARFLIEGHTDSWGEKAYNQALSERRARSVKAYLVSKGLEASRFESQGFGDAKPIADNRTSAGSRKNRRIAFKAL